MDVFVHSSAIASSGHRELTEGQKTVLDGFAGAAKQVGVERIRGGRVRRVENVRGI